MHRTGQRAQPAVEPARLADEPAQPAVCKAQVAVCKATLAVEPATLAVESARLAVESARLAVESARVAVEPATVAVEPAQVADEPATLAVEPATVAVEPAHVAVESAMVAVEPARQANGWNRAPDCIFSTAVRRAHSRVPAIRVRDLAPVLRVYLVKRSDARGAKGNGASCRAGRPAPSDVLWFGARGRFTPGEIQYWGSRVLRKLQTVTIPVSSIWPFQTRI
jgi:hypothetical protein